MVKEAKTEPVVLEMAARPDGSIVVIEETMVSGVFRTRKLTQMETWFKDGTINNLQLRSAEIFNEDHYDAKQHAQFAHGSMERVDSSPTQDDPLKYIKARERMNHVISTVGRANYDVLESCVGNEKSVTEYAQGARWNYKNMDRKEAKGRLLGALDMLVQTYTRLGIILA